MPKYKPGHYAVYAHGERSLRIRGPRELDHMIWFADNPADYSAGSVENYAGGADPLWVGTEAEWRALRKRSPTPADLLRNIEKGKSNTWAPRFVAVFLDIRPDWVGTQAEYDVLRAISPDAASLRINVERLNKAGEPEPEIDHSGAILAFLAECGFCAQTLSRAREVLADVSERANKLNRISEIVGVSVD